MSFQAWVVVGVAGLALLLAFPTWALAAGLRARDVRLAWVAVAGVGVQMLPALVAQASSNWLFTALLRTPAYFGWLAVPCALLSLVGFWRVARALGRCETIPRGALWLGAVAQLGLVAALAGTGWGLFQIPRPPA
jgi:hypothetical protein